MAKKRKKAKEQDEKFVYEPPEFDEVKYMEDEILAAKVGVVVALFAIPVAGVSYGLTLASVPIVAAFVGFGGIFLLKPVLEQVGFSTEDFERKSWAGHGALYFFTWLAVWVLLVNAPFSDLVGPSITQVKVIGGEVISVKAKQQVSIGVNNSSPEIVIQARIGDNNALREGSVLITIGGNTTSMSRSSDPNVYRYTFTDYTGGPFSVTIQADDEAGHHAEFPFTLRIT